MNDPDLFHDWSMLQRGNSCRISRRQARQSQPPTSAFARVAGQAIARRRGACRHPRKELICQFPSSRIGIYEFNSAAARHLLLMCGGSPKKATPEAGGHRCFQTSPPRFNRQAPWPTDADQSIARGNGRSRLVGIERRPGLLIRHFREQQSRAAGSERVRPREAQGETRRSWSDWGEMREKTIHAPQQGQRVFYRGSIKHRWGLWSPGRRMDRRNFGRAIISQIHTASGEERTAIGERSGRGRASAN